MEEYQYVYEVYREKSFSKAARKLYISQPALSATIRKIETRLGYCIFDRSTSRLCLTEGGEAYIDAARRILGIEEDLRTYIQDLTDLKTGHIVVSGTAFFSAYVLTPIMKRYRERYPGVEMELTEADSLELYQKAQDHEVDLIVDGGRYDRTHFDSRLLFEEHILLGIPADNPLNDAWKGLRLTADEIRQGRHLKEETGGICLSELRGEDFVLLKREHDLYERAMGLCRERGFTPGSTIHLNQLMTAYYIAAQGLGAVFLSDTLVKNTFGQVPMYYYRIETEHPELTCRDVFIAYRSDRHMTKAMEGFIRIGEQLYCS